MADNVKYVTLRDPITNEILVPRMIGSLGYEVIEGETIPPFAMKNDADTLQGHPASDFAKAGDMDATKAVLDGIGNQYVWAKQKAKDAYTSTYISSSSSDMPTSITFYRSDSFHVENGKFVLDEPIISGRGIDIAKNNSYMIKSSSSGTIMYYFDENSTMVGAGTYMNLTKYYKYTDPHNEYEIVGYTNSSDPTAYPPAESDGYTYELLGKLGGALLGVKIATGSYTGTGTYGENNPNSLTFDFEPKLLIVGTDSGESGHFIWIYGWSDFAGALESSTYPLTLNGNTISWYGSKAQNQYNLSGTKYYYIAIG